jgi:purine-binding chemotaxis protein CheW
MAEPLPTIEDQIVIFTLDELKYAIPLHSVKRVIHAVEIRFLPEAPEIISGIIDLQGQLIPVVNIRKRFGLADREISLDDQIIIADTGKREVAIVVDTVSGVSDVSAVPMKEAGKILPYAKHLKGVAKINDELILIYNLEQFLSLDEEKQLEKALKTKKK